MLVWGSWTSAVTLGACTIGLGVQSAEHINSASRAPYSRLACETLENRACMCSGSSLAMNALQPTNFDLILWKRRTKADKLQAAAGARLLNLNQAPPACQEGRRDVRQIVICNLK